MRSIVNIPAHMLRKMRASSMLRTSMAARAIVMNRGGSGATLFGVLPGMPISGSPVVGDAVAGADGAASSSVDSLGGDDDESRFPNAKLGDRDKSRSPPNPPPPLANEAGGDSSDSEDDEYLFNNARLGAGGDEDGELGVGGASVKQGLEHALNDTLYTGPTHTALFVRRGAAARAGSLSGRGASDSLLPPTAAPVGVPDDTLNSYVPLDDVGDSGLGAAYARATARAPGAAALDVTRAVVARRAMRVIYNAGDMRAAAAAAVLQYGDDLGGVPLTPGHDEGDFVNARRDTDFRPGEDPLRGERPRPRPRPAERAAKTRPSARRGVSISSKGVSISSRAPRKCPELTVSDL